MMSYIHIAFPYEFKSKLEDIRIKRGERSLSATMGRLIEEEHARLFITPNSEEEGDVMLGQVCIRLEEMLKTPQLGPRDNDLEHTREIVEYAKKDPEIAALWARAKRGLEDRQDIFFKVQEKKEEQKHAKNK